MESWSVEVFVPWSVTGYSWRPNREHVIPVNIEAWLSILHQFARQTGRATGTFSGGKTLMLGDGRGFAVKFCESRRARDEEG